MIAEIKWLRRVSFRSRIAFLSGSLLVTLSLALVLFINITAEVTAPTTDMQSLPVTLPIETPWHPGAPTPTPFAEPSTDPLPKRTAILEQVRLISVAGLLLVVIIGAAAAYWLAGRALQPLQELTQTARQISMHTLASRLILPATSDELQQVGDSFNAMLDRLEYGFVLQSEFVGNAAHELRTPLTTLRTNLEVLADDSTATLSDYRALLPVFDRTLTRMERLTTDLLIMAAAQEGDHVAVDLSTLLATVVEDLQPLATQHEIRLEYVAAEGIYIAGEASLLARVFSNLIENGIRYNQPGGSVAVCLTRGTAAVTIAVCDTGIGIAPLEQAKVWDRFYRVDRSRSRHKGGSGLGLAIVQHIVQQHGGQVQLTSTLGEGSEFTVSLPLSTEGSSASLTESL